MPNVFLLQTFLLIKSILMTELWETPSSIVIAHTWSVQRKMFEAQHLPAG